MLTRNSALKFVRAQNPCDHLTKTKHFNKSFIGLNFFQSYIYIKKLPAKFPQMIKYYPHKKTISLREILKNWILFSLPEKRRLLRSYFQLQHYSITKIHIFIVLEFNLKRGNWITFVQSIKYFNYRQTTQSCLWA